MVLVVVDLIIVLCLNKFWQNDLIVSFLWPGKLLIMMLLQMFLYLLFLFISILKLLVQVMVADGPFLCVVHMLELRVTVEGEVILQLKMNMLIPGRLFPFNEKSGSTVHWCS